MTQATSFATCHLCEANCGIVVQHDGTSVQSIRPDRDDPHSRGYICPKAAAIGDIQADGDRVRTPLRRRGSDWEEIGWDEALDEAATRLAEIQKRHGRSALAVYAGNPTVHSYAAVLFGQVMLKVLDTRNVFTANSVDGLPRLVVSRLLYGNALVMPLADIDRTDYLLMLGGNPLVSNGSLMSAPGVRSRIAGVRTRGGRVVVVDPRRTETAEAADEHVFIRPGTDALLLLGLLHVIFRERLERPTGPLEGLDRLRELARKFPPERVGEPTGVAPAVVARLARELAGAPTAACYGRLGTCTQRYGSLATWLIDVVNAVTGNLDRPGGTMFARPAADVAALAALAGPKADLGAFSSRVRGLPSFNAELPVAAFAEEIEADGPERVRALVTNAGNPVLSCPNGRRIEEALQRLELMVSVDLYVNETTRHAHLLLPPTFGLENDHFGLLEHTLALHNTVRYVPPVMAAPPGTRPDWVIMRELTLRIAARRDGAGALAAALLGPIARRIEPRHLLDLMIRLGPYGAGLRPWRRGLTLAKVRQHQHGMELGPLEPRLAEVLRHGSGRVELAPEPLVADVARLEAELAAPAARPELELIGRRHLLSNNSWMHNSRRLMKGKDRCTLQMHPEDAERLGLATGQRVRVGSRVGAVEAPLEVSDEVMPGVVSLPHGWGHGRAGTRLETANARAGACANDLTDDAVVDAVSGCATLNGVPVMVSGI